MLWLLASDDKTLTGELPVLSTISFRLRIGKEELSNIIRTLGDWVEYSDSELLATSAQRATPETEAEAETDLTPNGVIAAGKPAAKRRTTKPKPKTDGSKVWEAYANEYRRRYQCDPVRDAKANTICANLVKALGASEAPEIARWYVGSNDSWFVRRKHPLGDLLANAQRFATEWRQGHRGTATEAMDQDRRAEQAGVYDRVIEKINRGEL
jgi:hypothetical protein